MPAPEDVEAISLSEIRSTASASQARLSNEFTRVDSKASVEVYPVASSSTSREPSVVTIDEGEDTAQLNESSLAPVDGGWRAWSFVSCTPQS